VLDDAKIERIIDGVPCTFLIAPMLERISGWNAVLDRLNDGEPAASTTKKIVAVGQEVWLLALQVFNK
jgi:hypothetical protein